MLHAACFSIALLNNDASLTCTRKLHGLFFHNGVRYNQLNSFVSGPRLPSEPSRPSCTMRLSVSCLYCARSSAGLASYAVGLRFALASSSSPALSASRPGRRLSCACWMLCKAGPEWD